VSLGWAELRPLLEELLAAPEEERTAVLERITRGDGTLRAELETYLALEDDAAQAFDEPLRVLPDRIGRYRILHEIGRGGMGVVYLGERDADFVQQAAIKVIKRGMDTDEIIDRFRRERQILANLQHPYIARLLDGGATADGQPYLAMEYIDGEPLAAYLERVDPPLGERLRLFQKIASAVEFAHRNLVVHRDLKPGNIFVLPNGDPKLLDFGIAKVLTAEGAADATVIRAFTPAYASPEQIAGAVVTSASDIYSLGLILREMLPADGVSRSRRQELDAIVSQATQDNPKRRYASVEQLSDDIERFLDKRPLRARKPTLTYRLGKFAVRRRVPLAAGALVAASLAIGGVATWWQARLAERRFELARGMADAAMTDIYSAIEELPGATAARKLILDRSLHYLEALEPESSGREELRRDLAAGYKRVGEALYSPGRSSLGDVQGARRSFEKAGSLYESLVRAHPNDSALRRQFAVVRVETAVALRSLKQSRTSRAYMDEGIAILEQEAQRQPDNRQALADVAFGYNYQLDTFVEREDWAGLVNLDRKLLAIWVKLGDVRNIALGYKHLGAALIKTGRNEDALENYRRACAIEENDVQTHPQNARAKLDLASGYSDIGYIYSHQGRLQDAEAATRKSMALRQAVVSADPNDHYAAERLAVSHSKLGEILRSEGKLQEAAAEFQAAVDTIRPLVATMPEDSRSLEDYQSSLGEVQRAMRSRNEKTKPEVK